MSISGASCGAHVTHTASGSPRRPCLLAMTLGDGERLPGGASQRDGNGIGPGTHSLSSPRGASVRIYVKLARVIDHGEYWNSVPPSTAWPIFLKDKDFSCMRSRSGQMVIACQGKELGPDAIESRLFVR